MTTSLYWHDYETWGAEARRDRPVQFAGLRTDLDLNPIGEPLSIYCRPANDMLPQPEACLVTGITPQKAMSAGLCEAEFMAAINAELARPGTCTLGYNSIRFDDEVTRHCLYRNFFDPYAREWRHGNSRWDIIDMVRLTHALRPEGIEWPAHDDGTPSFRLEDLTVANGIAHEEAHDALADVKATLALAKLIKQRQPRLFDYLWRMRDKASVSQLFDLREMEPVLHVSAMYPSVHGCIALVAPISRHPVNKNAIIVYDLRHDPAPFFGLTEEELQLRLFTPRRELPPDIERLPVKAVHLNRCPVIVPTSTLSDDAARRWQIDMDSCEHHRQRLKESLPFIDKIRRLYVKTTPQASSDPDQALYSGFFNDEDRARIKIVRESAPEALIGLEPAFTDPRLPELLFRYRARNWPETLSAEETLRWDEYRARRLASEDGGSSITLAEFRARVNGLLDEAADERTKRILSDLSRWADALGIG